MVCTAVSAAATVNHRSIPSHRHDACRRGMDRLCIERVWIMINAIGGLQMEHPG
jgi:hypothetical protein